MSTPTSQVPQSPLSMVQLAVIRNNVLEQISTMIGAPCIRANLNAGCYVPPEYEQAAKDCIDRALADVQLMIVGVTE